MKEIKLNEKQKECIKGLIGHREVAHAAFVKASEMVHDSEKRFWNKVVELWPNAKTFKHPDDGDWVVIVDEKEVSDK